jgi:hypothetical protein
MRSQLLVVVVRKPKQKFGGYVRKQLLTLGDGPVCSLPDNLKKEAIISIAENTRESLRQNRALFEPYFFLWLTKIQLLTINNVLR